MTATGQADTLEAFLNHVAELGIELYPAQEEAILELFSGSHVIITTPTGSGKSLVALAAHFRAVHQGGRSCYTAPTKALVSEKFFELCDALGAQHVGMLTGDASINPRAPVLCCTQEVLANLSLAQGAATEADTVVMDEFHFYGDRERGWAWQVPLLQLTDTQFVLMTATMGNSRHLAADIRRRTGRPVATVSGMERPVPLTFTYRNTTLHESLEELIELRRTPVYIVHATQKAATQRAQALSSLNVLSADEKRQVRDQLADIRFDTPFGTDVKRLLGTGVGVHHAGMLPKYRLLTERLAQQGLLRLICGTDTLGVGVNVPIRTVLFTQLFKFDGRKDRLLNVREFHQVAGRAGRRGFDDDGFVWCQAPEHEVENAKALAKAGDDPKARRKVRRKSPPARGYVHWNQQTFERLAAGEPEPLRSRFTVTHSMLLLVLGREGRDGDGCAALRRLLTDNHEPRERNRHHIRQAIAMYRSLRDEGIVHELPEPTPTGQRVQLAVDLHRQFALNQPLSPFVLAAIELFDPADDQFALDVLSVVEATLEPPRPVLEAQRELAAKELKARLLAEGVPYEQRVELLEACSWPAPLADELTEAFELWRTHHPWVGGAQLQPKSVARDLIERAMTFREYVNHYGVKRSEGVLLRYLTDAYKALKQTIPPSARTDDVTQLTGQLGELVRQTDDSLLAEWERVLALASETAAEPAAASATEASGSSEPTS